MAHIDLEEAYDSHGESIHELFGKREEGLFVPAYQRKYTWEDDNINQLFDDLLLGVQDFTGPSGDNAVTFLGTVIVTNLADTRATVGPGDNKAQPTGVRLVIDGQQRISTIALISVQLTECLKDLQAVLPQAEPFSTFHHHCRVLLGELRSLYTVRVANAVPPDKPRIIREQEDRWTHHGDDSSYRSSIARYVAGYIRTGSTTDAAANLDNTVDARVRSNAALIKQRLTAVCEAHVPETLLFNQFPVGEAVGTERVQEDVLGFADPSIRELLESGETDPKAPEYVAVSMYSLFLVSYYLLKRCGINRLKAKNEEWGFDMFQALNATGTPLTALETLLPQVIQAEQRAGVDWENSPSAEYMEEVERLFEKTKTNVEKNHRTNELLRSFALGFEGEKLGDKFSAQRKWLKRLYGRELPEIAEKRAWLAELAQVAGFYRRAWYMEELEKPHHLRGLEEHPEGELASLLVQYLKGANSKLSAAVLARYYRQLRKGESEVGEFVEAAKACAAFFTLWRSARSTSGLDEVYRRFFRGSEVPVETRAHSWSAFPKGVSAAVLKEYFMETLRYREIGEREAWARETGRFLRYTDARAVCRFVLFVAGEDRVPREDEPGLSGRGLKGTCSLLQLSRWEAKDYKTLEHVAPQSRPKESGWDPEIYSEGLVHDVGNLILLPAPINSLADNKEWASKFLYYSHVGLRDEAEVERLRGEAERRGLVLNGKTTRLLRGTRHNCAVAPILSLGASGSWDAGFVGRRSRQIKELAWNTLSSWLRTM